MPKRMDNLIGGGGVTDEEHDKRMSHPFVRKVHEMMLNTGMHPGDLRLANMGKLRHPITGKDIPLIADYGFSHITGVPEAYAELRKRQLAAQYG